MNWQRINSRMKHNARKVRVIGDDFRSEMRGNHKTKYKKKYYIVEMYMLKR